MSTRCSQVLAVTSSSSPCLPCHVILLRWTACTTSVTLSFRQLNVLLECTHRGHVLVLYLKTRGDFVVVGDVMQVCHKQQLLAHMLNSQCVSCGTMQHLASSQRYTFRVCCEAGISHLMHRLLPITTPTGCRPLICSTTTHTSGLRTATTCSLAM